MDPVTLGVIVIGNEILSGKVLDSNSAFLAREIREVGAELRRVIVVPDDVDEIAEVVRDFRQRFDVVVTTGSAQPTRDPPPGD
jgi:molybdenum cofactor synthesis domain-containing protein